MQTPSKAFIDLERFLSQEMKMTHVYQPTVVRELLRKSGAATLDEIARALLLEDQAQLDYYRHIFKRWPLSTLKARGIVCKETASFILNNASELTADETFTLIQLCTSKIDTFLQSGRDPWDHRRKSSGYISGSLRFTVLKRAQYRCELCGASASEAALHLDHIIPRSKGGMDDESNLQALCQNCNSMKRDQDDTDFRGMSTKYETRQAGCPFCSLPEDRTVDEDRLTVAIRDSFPVTEGHTLIIPQRHFQSGGDITQSELNSVWRMQAVQRQQLKALYPDITGFNFGLNDGTSAGQTIPHCHFHLIPRRDNDTANPRGGVRGVIPDKQAY